MRGHWCISRTIRLRFVTKIIYIQGDTHDSSSDGCIPGSHYVVADDRNNSLNGGLMSRTVRRNPVAKNAGQNKARTHKPAKGKGSYRRRDNDRDIREQQTERVCYEHEG